MNNSLPVVPSGRRAWASSTAIRIAAACSYSSGNSEFLRVARMITVLPDILSMPDAMAADAVTTGQLGSETGFSPQPVRRELAANDRPRMVLSRTRLVSG